MVTSATRGVLAASALSICAARARSSTCRPPPTRRPRSRTGVRGGCRSPRNSLLREPEPVDGLDVEAEQPRQRQVDLLAPPRGPARRRARAAADRSSCGQAHRVVLAQRGPRGAVELDVRGRQLGVPGEAETREYLVGRGHGAIMAHRPGPGAGRRPGVGPAPPRRGRCAPYGIRWRACAESSATSGRNRTAGRSTSSIEGLARLEYRGYDSAGVALVTEDGVATEKRAGKLANLEKSALDEHPLSAVADRRSGTPAGPPTARPTDVNAHPHLGGEGDRLALIHNGIIENFAALRSELARRGRRVRAPRPTPRSRPTCSRRRVRPASATSPRRCRRVCRPARGRLHPRRRRRAGRPAGVVARPPQLARSSSGVGDGENFLGSRRRGVHRATPGDALELGQDQIVTITRRRRRRHRLRRRARRGHGVPRRLGRRRRREGRLRLPSCARRSTSSPTPSPTPCWAVTDDAGRLVTGRDADPRGRAARRRQDHRSSRAAPPSTPGMVAKYAIEHWTRIPVEVELAHEFRYRDPIVDPQHPRRRRSASPARPMDTLMAVRHAREQRREGAGDLQHQRLDDPARVRRRALHPRRPRDRGRLHQGLPRPRSSPATCSGSTSRRCAARRYGDEITAVLRELARDARARSRTSSAGWAASPSWPQFWPTAGPCCSSAGTSATRWRSRGR